MANSSNDNWGCGCLVILVILVWGGYGIFQWSESAGYTPHTKTVDVYMKGDWLVGENRTCAGIQTLGDAGHPKEMTALLCPIDAEYKDPHNLNVKFWGRISRPDASVLDEASGTKGAWLCTRESDTFTCKAIN
jgi:hypothetical protein